MKNISHYKDSKHYIITKMDKENAHPYTKIKKKKSTDKLIKHANS